MCEICKQCHGSIEQAVQEAKFGICGGCLVAEHAKTYNVVLSVNNVLKFHETKAAENTNAKSNMALPE